MTRRPVVLRHLADGSFLTLIDGRRTRMIEAQVNVTGQDGSRVDDRYRLITTLLDHDRYPAEELVALYHERWEVEIAFYAMCHTLLEGHLLRSGDRPGLEQEIWAMLVLYQVLRMAMNEAVEAIESRSGNDPGINPDRASFTVALDTAREQVIRAADITIDPDNPLAPGAIEATVAATLLPARRARWSSRKVKNRRYRWSHRDHGSRPDLPTAIASIDVDIHTPPLTPDPVETARRRAARVKPRDLARPPRRTRRMITIELMQTDPDRAWSGKEIAAHLDTPPRNTLTQLAEWTRLGWLHRDTRGRYSLPTHQSQPLPEPLPA